VKLPNDIADRDVILLDPMLATGNSTAARSRRQARGRDVVRLIALIAAPEGIERIHRDHPTSRSSSRSSTARSTRRATSCPASATQATACTARSRSRHVRGPASEPRGPLGSADRLRRRRLLTPPSAGWRGCSASSTGPAGAG
jgi:hypothetical protein